MTVVTVSPVLSVPCEARLIKAAVDCYGQVAVVTWYPSGGATSYIVTAATASGVNVTCEANDTAHCDLEGLLCGHSYSVSVTATGQTCSSVAHMTEPLVTGEPRHTGPSAFVLELSLPFSSRFCKMSLLRSLISAFPVF